MTASTHGLGVAGESHNFRDQRTKGTIICKCCGKSFVRKWSRRGGCSKYCIDPACEKLRDE